MEEHKNQNNAKSKLSLRRKPGRKEANFTGQRLSTKHLVAPKLKSSWLARKVAEEERASSRDSSNKQNKGLGGSLDDGGESEITGEEQGRGGEVEKDRVCNFAVHVRSLDFGVEEGIGENGGMGLGGVASSAAGEEGLGKMFFCHICQKDLTRFDLNLRQAHLNRCCDETSADPGEGRQKHVCVLCGKTFLKDSVSYKRPGFGGEGGIIIDSGRVFLSLFERP